MSQTIEPVNQTPAMAQPFSRTINTEGVNAGSVAIEQERAIAEAQGQLILAKRFPRDLTQSHVELMESCRIPALASVAFYSVPRGGSKVSGPSIRLAEEIARVYGNFEYGHRELSRSETKSEVEVFAWDKEKNNRSVRQLTVMHTRDTKDGQVPLRDQKDIDDKISNIASKQVRGRILALMPKWMVESAIQECQKTLAGKNDEPITVRVRRMVDAFGKLGVKAAQIESYIGHKVDDATPDDIIDLTGVFNAIRDGAKISEFFNAAPIEAPTLKTAEKKPAAPKATQKAAQPAAEVPHEKPVAAEAAPAAPPAPPIAEPTPESASDGDFDFDFGGE